MGHLGLFFVLSNTFQNKNSTSSRFELLQNTRKALWVLDHHHHHHGPSLDQDMCVPDEKELPNTNWSTYSDHAYIAWYLNLVGRKVWK